MHLLDLPLKQCHGSVECCVEYAKWDSPRKEEGEMHVGYAVYSTCFTNHPEGCHKIIRARSIQIFWE